MFFASRPKNIKIGKIGKTLRGSKDGITRKISKRKNRKDNKGESLVDNDVEKNKVIELKSTKLKE